jgi:hypothetical protein
MANTKSNQSCTGLVANAEWNTALSITQTWNGSGRVPITIGSYSTTGSTTECRFKCKENYTYNGGNNTCVANTKTGQLCTSLVANAEWNTVSSITQTWDGSTRTPTTTGSYNITGSTAECRFKCKDGYAWDGATSTCATTCENGAIGIVGTAGHVRNPSNGTITITDGTCGFIIQDKNVGATTVGIGSSSAEIGNYYQWGNRCGRSSAAAPSLTTTTLVTSISENSTYPSSCS